MSIKKIFFNKVFLILIFLILGLRIPVYAYAENDQGYPHSYDTSGGGGDDHGGGGGDDHGGDDQGGDDQGGDDQGGGGGGTNTPSDPLASLVADVLSQFRDADGNIDTNRPEVRDAINGIKSSVPAAQTLSQEAFNQVVDSAVKNNNSVTQGDPVQTNTGSFTTTETDIHFVYNENEIKFERTYTSSNKSKGSLGTGWESSIDESLIFGTLYNIENIYTTYLTKYNQSYQKYLELASKLEAIKSYGQQVMDRSEVSSKYEAVKTNLNGMADELYILKQLINNAEVDYTKTLDSIERNKYNYKLGVTRQETNIGCDRILFRTGTGLTRTFVTTDGVNYQMNGIYGDYTLIKSNDKQFVLTTPKKQKITFDYWGRKVSEEDINGNLISYEYDTTSGLLKTISDSSNRKIVIYRNPKGKIISIEAPEQTLIQFAYNSNELLSSVIDAKGDAVRYEYNGTLLTKIIKPDNSFLKYEYDNQNRIIYTQDEEGNREYFTYDSALKLTQYTNPAGHVIKHYHDDRYRQIKNEYEDGTEESYAYDEYDNLIKFTDRRGNQTSYTYDERKNKLSQTDADGVTQKWTYNEFNKVTTYKAKNNSLTTYNYNSLGNLISVIYPDGTSEKYTYDSHGRVISHTDCNGGTEYYEYYATGNLKQKTDANNNSTLYEYDELGRVTKSINPELKTIQNVYYKDGQLKSKTDSYGNSEFFEYNERKDLVKHVDYEGNETLYVYNRKHEVLRIIDAEGIVRGFEYTPDGKVKLEKKGKLLDKYLISNTTDNENEKQLYIMTVGEVIELVESGEADDAVEKRLAFLKNLNSKLNLDDVSDGVAWLIHTSYEYDENGYVKHTKNLETEEEILTKYDSLGNLEWKQDAEENKEFFSYDSMNRLQNHTDSYGNSEYFGYDKMGNLNWHKDKNGNERSWEYNIMNRLEIIIDAENNETQQIFDSCGRLIKKIDALGNKTEYDYDKCGNLISQKDANGYITKYGYDKSGLLVSITDARNNTTYKGYDKNGRLISETDADGNSKFYTLNKNGVVIAIKDRLDNEWLYELDTNGKTVKATDPYGAETRYEYDINGNVCRVTDALNFASFIEYDVKGRVLNKIDALSNVTKYEYDKNGNLRYETDGEGRVTEYKYDELNRLIETVSSGGDSVQYKYDNEKNVTEFIDAKGESYKYLYDSCGRKIEETDRLGNKQKYEYDAVGNLITKIDFNGAKTNYKYDKTGHQIKVEFEDGSSKAFSYDKVYNLITAENGVRSNSYSYDNQNRIITSKDNDIGQTIKYEYDSEGRRTKITYLEGKRYQKYIWGKTGKLLSVRDKEGNITVYSYDKLGRETGVEYPNHVKESRKYDASGRLVMVKAELHGAVLGAESYVYDNSGKRLFTVNEGGKLEAYTYDANGRVNNVLYSFAGGKISNDYEERLEYGLFPEYKSIDDYTDSVLLDFDFPETLDINKEDLIEAIRNILNSKKDVYEGFTGKKLSGHGTWCIKPEDIKNFGKFMSPSGRERQMLEAALARIVNGKGVYGGQSLVWAENYKYDENGNRISKTNGWGTLNYEYDAENRLTKAGNRTYSYDLNGNLIQENLGKIATAYDYNAENRVVDVNTQVQGMIGHWCGWGYWAVYGRQELKSGVRYEYDALGRRVTRAEYTTTKSSFYGWQRQWTSSTVTESQYDGLGMNVLQEFNDTDYHPDYGMPWAPWFGFSYIRPLWGYYAPFTFGRWDMYVPAGKYNPVSEYVYGNNLVSRSDYDEKYAWSGRFTGTEYYTTDILGSVMLTTDSLGRVSNRYNYDAYGTNYTGSFSGKNKIGYNSKHYDTGTGWYNYGYRDYDSKLGRFTTQDPIRDGMNWYAYCGGDPINLIDLWGLFTESDLNLAGVPSQYRDLLIAQYNNSHLLGSGEQLASNMEALVGSNYVWGGNSPEDGGMDCSGSLIYGINQMGNNVSDQTAAQLYNLTSSVSGEIQPGDLRFLSDSNGNINHVQTIVGEDGSRVNATGGPENTIDNPGTIELLPGPLPNSGEIRRLNFR